MDFAVLMVPAAKQVFYIEYFYFITYLWSCWLTMTAAIYGVTVIVFVW